MKRITKKLMFVLTMIVLCFCMVSMGNVAIKAKAITEKDFYSKISNFQSEHYSHNDHYQNNESGTLGSQCFGYANYIARYIFGSFPSSWSNGRNVREGWTVTYGASALNNLHVGDIIRYKSSTANHSVFVTKISGNTIYFTDANSDSNNTVKFDSSRDISFFKERIAMTIDDGYTGWVAHYNNWEDTPVFAPMISDDKNTVVVGEDISFWYSGLTECQKVEFHFSKYGEEYYIVDSTTSTTFKTYFTSEGLYQVFARGYYNDHTYDSKKITVVVLDPSISADKTTVCINEPIVFTYSGLKESEEVQIEFSKNGTVYFSPDSTYSRSYSTCFVNPGIYSVNVVGKSNGSWYRSTKVTITVTDHNYGSWIKLNDTQHQRFCSHNNSHIEKANHSWNSGDIIKDATHLVEGIKAYTCSACGDSYTEAIDKLTKHTYEATEIAPTCTTQGYTTYTCECGDSYVDDYSDKLNHEYTSEIITPATHLKEGVLTYTCSDCGDTYSDKIDKITEHTYNEKFVAPSCTETGYTIYACACGDTYIDNYISETGHNDNNNDGTCDGCGIKLETEDNDNSCSCNCHKSGIIGIIWKILKFFYNLLGTNKTCGCGVAHY